MAYQVITALNPALLASAVYTASLNGWLAVGGASSSGSALIQAMTRQETLYVGTVLGNSPTQSLNSGFPAGATGPWSFGFPSDAGIPGI